MSQADLHRSTKHLDEKLARNLANSSDDTSWRSDPTLFNPDSEYIRSGFANVSPGWYMVGRNVGITSVLLWHRTECERVLCSPHLMSLVPLKSFVNITVECFLLMRGMPFP